MADDNLHETMELLRILSQQDIERQKFELERDKWQAEQRHRKRLWDGAPLNATVLVAILGGLFTIFAGYYQVQANRHLERTKYESALVLTALEPVDSLERVLRLNFLVRTGLISDPDGKIERATRTAPQFEPANIALSRPLTSDARVFVLAGNQAKLNERAGLQGDLTKAGYAVLGARSIVDETRPAGPEVRYFNPSDEAQADSVAAFIKRRYALPTDSARFYLDPSAKNGYLEVWLGR